MALPDEVFSPSRKRIDFESAGLDKTIRSNTYYYGTQREGKYVNIAFEQANRAVDIYFDPEDLERLGILFQYLGKTAREKRDGDG